MKIRLKHAEWEFDPNAKLGKPGQFGEVYSGTSQTGELVAVKEMHFGRSTRVNREMRIAAELIGKDHSNVIPILDAGFDDESEQYYVVMALAEMCLNDKIVKSGPLSDSEVVQILADITSGLLNLPQLVHRDLKPANVLLHQNKWKLADFGISKLIEEATSQNTMQAYFSPPYAAPEQWKHESVTHATDIYSLACIGYFLKTGSPPFSGQREELRQKHIEAVEPSLDNVDPQLQTLLRQMLRKAASLRPSTSDVLKTLNQLSNRPKQSAPSIAHQKLAELGAKAATERAVVESEANKLARLRQDRERMAKDAVTILRSEIALPLIESIVSASPAVTKSKDGFEVSLLKGSLMINAKNDRVSENAFRQSGWDVLTAGTIGIRQRNPDYVWSASLWFTNLGSNQKHRWYEVAYMSHPLLPSLRTHEPFYLDDLNLADKAALTSMGSVQFAYKPKPIDGPDFEAFLARWTERFVAACDGKLSKPRNLPLIEN